MPWTAPTAVDLHHGGRDADGTEHQPDRRDRLAEPVRDRPVGFGALLGARRHRLDRRRRRRAALDRRPRRRLHPRPRRPVLRRRRRGGGLVPLRDPTGRRATTPSSWSPATTSPTARTGTSTASCAACPTGCPGWWAPTAGSGTSTSPPAHPLVRVVMISPALDFGRGAWSYDDGTTHQAWLTAAVTGARAAGIPWVVVGMHKPCLSVGNYECDPGTELVDLLLDTGVDLVRHGARAPLPAHEAARPGRRVPHDPPGALRPRLRRDRRRHDLRHGRHRWHRPARRARLGLRAPLLRRAERQGPCPVARLARRAGERPTG